MKTCELIEAIRTKSESVELMETIDKLSYAERLNIREVLTEIELPRNLFYDYKKQCWV